MKRTATLFTLALGAAFAQVPNPTSQSPVANAGQTMPMFRVTVVSRTTTAINYHHRTGTTPINFRGTSLMPTARGQADVSSQMGSTKINAYLNKMTPANQYGPEYMTFVMWAITPEGRPANLGEVVLEGDHAKLQTATDLQTFGLIVTAEPYFAVTQPSDVVVAENFLNTETQGTIEHVNAKFELLQRGVYVFNRGAYHPVKVNPKGPLQVAEAENAVEIARLAGAEKYAGDTFQKALVDLKNAEDFLNGKSKDRKSSETNAREAAQMAEDARLITYRKIQDEQLADERAAAASREAQAKAEAEKSAREAEMAQQRATAEQQARSQAEAERKAAEQAKADAQAAQASAEAAAAQAARERAAADAAKAAALAQQQSAMAEADRAKAAAMDADKARLQAEQDKEHLRAQLLTQLNAVLETRETQRGLIVNISDVLFDFNKYTLKPGAREKLAKVSGILLAYPGLTIQLEGHTDSVGTDDYNMTLSEHRAESVQSYMVSQGVPANTMTAKGLGKSDPVASNDTAAGRQQNRRVDMVVSGEPIGLGSLQPSQR